MEKQGTLRGKHIYLEPMDKDHVAGLAAISVPDITLYQWSPVPQGIEEVTKYIQNGIDLREKGSLYRSLFFVWKIVQSLVQPAFGIWKDGHGNQVMKDLAVSIRTLVRLDIPGLQDPPFVQPPIRRPNYFY